MIRGRSEFEEYTRVSTRGRTKDLKSTLPSIEAGDVVDHPCGWRIGIPEDALVDMGSEIDLIL